MEAGFEPHCSRVTMDGWARTHCEARKSQPGPARTIFPYGRSKSYRRCLLRKSPTLFGPSVQGLCSGLPVELWRLRHGPHPSDPGQDRQWLNDAQFAEGLSISQVVPGPNALNVTSYLGYQLGGWPGAITALLGLTTIPFIIVMALGLAYFENGSRPAVRQLLLGLRRERPPRGISWDGPRHGQQTPQIPFSWWSPAWFS